MLSKYSQFGLLPPENGTPNGNCAIETQLTGNVVFNQHNPDEFFFQVDITFEKDVEDEADVYFKRIYNRDLPDCMEFDQFFSLLKELHKSEAKRDNDMFLCMLRNLLREYRFLAQYPDRELVITGELFGGLIEHNLITSLILVIVLKYILDSLKKSPHTKDFRFAITALDRFKMRLRDFPGLCTQIFNIPHFGEFPPTILPYIQYGRSCLEPQTYDIRNLSSEVIKKVSEKPTEVLHQNSIMNIVDSNNDALLSQIRDKLQFMFNNLDYSKLDKFADLIKELLDNKQFYTPIATYFTKRAIAESNHHQLFIRFLEIINLNELFNMILRKTYSDISGLFSEAEKKNLKSAASWLGLITLARNKPILTINLDLHKMLIDACLSDSQRLSLVLPFVAKILLGCSNSVFKPPNPWTVSLINLLVEIYFEVTIDLNLKFEVEILCTTLEIDIEKYKGQSNYLKNHDSINKLDKACGSPTRPVQSSPLSPNESPCQSASTPLSVQSTSILTENETQITMPSPPHPSSVPLQPTPSLNLVALSQNLMIKDNLQLCRMNPQIKTVIIALIEKTLYDFLTQVVERFIKECLTTVEFLVKKDFALDGNPEVLRTASLNALKCLISGFSLIHSKEQLSEKMLTSMLALLESKFSNAPLDLIEITAATIVNDNLEVCVNFVQNTCIERSVEELDLRLKNEYEIRRNSLSDGMSYCDKNVLSFQKEKIPEPIRVKRGPIPMKKLLVYDEMGLLSTEMFSFTRPNIVPPPISPALSNQSYQSILPNELPQTNDETLSHLYEQLRKKSLEVTQELDFANYNSRIILLVSESLKQAKQSPRDQTVAYNLISNTVNGLRELLVKKDTPSDYSVITHTRDFYLLILKAITDQRAFNISFIANNVTRCVMKHWFTLNQSFPDDLFDILSKASLINFATLDQEFSTLLENMQHTAYFVVILDFLNYYLRNGINPNVFSNTMESFRKLLNKIKQTHPFAVQLKNLFDLCHFSQPGNQASSNSEVSQNNALNFETVEHLFKEWLTCFHTNNGFQNFFNDLARQGVLKSEDTLIRFFKACLEICVQLCYQIFNSTSSTSHVHLYDVHNKCFKYLDAFAYLILFFIKIKDNFDYKMQILNKSLSLIAYVAYQDQEIHKQQFHYLPYYRILVVLFLEFCNNYSIYGLDKYANAQYHKLLFEQINTQIVKQFCNVLHLMSPTKLPSFIFAWLEFISHRSFIGSCLNDSSPGNKLWNFYFSLINDLLTFEKPFIQNVELSASIKYLYKGTLKLFLLLLHDFPEFLCEYCYLICELIPHTAFQIRNLVLTAYPASMRLPDPFSANLKVESLNEIHHPYKGIINNASFDKLPFKDELDIYLKSRNSQFLSEICKYFVLNHSTLPEQLSYINQLVFYFGQYAIKMYSYITLSTIASCPTIVIIQQLLSNLDTERRYFILSSMVNHLRYPNMETQYFICVLLYLFKESEEFIKEQIVRVLLERLFVFRPHPWGLLYIANQLSKNPSYNFWNYDFIKFEPKIKRILGNLGIENRVEF